MLPAHQNAAALNTDHRLVYPCGNAVGICLYTNGLLVTGDSPIIDQNGREIRPAIDAGIQKGDLLLQADGKEISSIEGFCASVSQKEGSLLLTVERNGQTFTKSVTPVHTDVGTKIGLWVRDSTAGIGTITYYNPNDQTLGALGHGIADIDTGSILSVKKGNILPCLITPPTKGEKGAPGELNGSFSSSPIGSVAKNTGEGIFCRAEDLSALTLPEPVPVARRDEITEGPAYILCDVDGSGVRPYHVEIKKYNPGRKDGKNFVLKVTDETLIEKTGGIVQGMSGSPIIQNHMLVGAVTHVFVNNPTKGYGILAEHMLAESEKNQ